MKHDDGGPAFPGGVTDCFITSPHGMETASAYGFEPKPGMTLLDWFAGQAMAEAVEVADSKGVARIKELLDGATEEPDDSVHRSELIAREAYIFAAAMLAEKRRREASPPSGPSTTSNGQGGGE